MNTGVFVIFTQNDKDELFLAGKPGNYTYEDVAGNLRFSEVRLLSLAIALHFVSSDMEIANNEHYPGNGCFVV